MSSQPPSTATLLERLVRETPDLIAELNLGRVLQQVADLARALLSAKYSAVGLLHPDQHTVESFTTSGVPAGIGEGTVESRPRRVLGEPKILRLNAPSDHPGLAGFPVDPASIRSFLAVPIVGRRALLGNLYLVDKLGAPEFSAEDERLAILLSTIVGSAVENAMSHEQTIRLLDEVQQLHRSRERFFAMVNHELRNSLTAVYGWAEMLIRKKDPTTVPRGIHEILEAAEQAVALINDLLDLNRLDEDRIRPVMRDIDCSSIIRAAVQRVAASAREKQVTLVAHGVDQVSICRTDAHRAEQIVVNVLSNAIKHAPTGSSITVTVRSEPDVVRFEIEDQGPGVAPEDVDRIFDIFYTTTGRERLNQGIGLPLSRRLARRLGGDLVVVSRSGQGALFTLSLPKA